jgi:molybdate transport system substrate-binding protein
MKQTIAVAAIVLVAASCGGSGDRLTVDAASSLTEVFQQLDPKARFNFGGSDELAFQIEQGAKTDVYASASTKYPEQLAAKGLVEPPRVFATNTLVLIVPRSNAAQIESLGGLMKAGVKLVLAAPGVPAGDYARKTLARYCKSIFLPEGAHCPRAKVVSEEPDVKGVVAKIALDEADAGFVYATDARAAGGKVRAISVPALLQPPIRYSIAVLRRAPHRDDAERFVRLVLGSSGRAALRRAGFGVP